MSEQVGVGEDVSNNVKEDEEADAPGRMSFLDHLDELRRRSYSVYSVLAACVVSFIFIREILDFVTKPMLSVLPNQQLLSTDALDPIMLWFAGLLVAVIIASPLIMLQVWYFIAPGLCKGEAHCGAVCVQLQRLVCRGRLFLASRGVSSDLEFLAAFNKGLPFQNWMPTAASAFSLYLRMVIGLGLVFQMPVVIFVLSKFGIVSADSSSGISVRGADHLHRGGGRPGGDPMSQLVFVAPMLVLYVISIGVAWLFGKAKVVEAD